MKFVLGIIQTQINPEHMSTEQALEYVEHLQDELDSILATLQELLTNASN